MSGLELPERLKLKYRVVKHEMNDLIPLREYAASQNLTVWAIYYKIRMLQITAYKIQSRWYILRENSVES